MKLILNGCLGRMGRAVTELAPTREAEVVAGVDIAAAEAAYPIATEWAGLPAADAVIDFSNPAGLAAELRYVTAHNLPLVLCTTGLSADQLTAVHEAAKVVPVFMSSNMSLGVAVLSALTKKAAAILGDTFDIEIVEMHHNQKLDAPSGTALMLADAAKAGLSYEPEYTYDRHTRRQKREKKEIGIAALRGGTVVGEHSVYFAGEQEVLTLSHSAGSRSVFAAGALTAARFLQGKPAGLYSMEDILDGI
ncbi:MAG: 4-hydroxy-tetrahydrodipicolinate reductase [Ruminococcaceae bacterium]|nr:4-hydroxy-tetrahydrodipicolinate reductase [Oscillospiraceae bacterium]